MAVARLPLPTEHAGAVLTAQRRSWRAESRTPLLIAATAYVIALVSGNRLLNDPDTFLHIAIGRWIWAHGFVPAVDPFSSTVLGQPWIAHERLSGLIFAGVYGAVGWAGVNAVTGLALAATFFLLAMALSPLLRPLMVAVLITASFLLLAPHLLARPHVLAMPLLVAWVIGLEHARDAKCAPSYLLLPLMTLWANLHGGFVVGLGLTAFYALEAILRQKAWPSRRQAARQWGGALLGAALAALVTPYGLKGFWLAFHLLHQSFALALVSEWRSTDFGHFQPLEVWVLGLLAVGYWLRLQMSLSRLLLLLGLVHLALVHSRNADLLAIIGPVLLARPLQRALHEPPERVTAPSLACLAGVASAMAIATVAAVAIGTAPNNQHIAPTAALSAASAAGAAGPVLNAYNFGGYLAFAGQRPFIDGRIELYGDAFIRSYMQAMAGDDNALRDELDAYHIGWTLLDPATPAVAALDRLPGWERIYADDAAVVHRRRRNSPP